MWEQISGKVEKKNEVDKIDKEWKPTMSQQKD